MAPGDVAFSLSGNSNSSSEDGANSDSVSIVESAGREDLNLDGICMSVSSFVVGLVMLLLLLVVASLVAAFLFVRVRAIHKKAGVFGPSGFDNPEYLKHSIGVIASSLSANGNGGSGPLSS